MKIRMAAFVAVGALISAPVWADDPKFEMSGNVGWSLSDGVTGSGGGIRGGDGNIYNGIGPKDSLNWGFTLGYHVTPNWELEFLYDRQESKLELVGTGTKELGDFPVVGYHGAFAYNWGEADSKVRPFAFIGAGATDYKGRSFTRLDGSTGEIGGSSRFSGTFGVGVKAYPSSHAGLRIQARWTPTYIKSDPGGWWCDPYWGCYVESNPQYSNQIEFTGGLTLRF